MGFVFPWERWLRQELRPRIAALFADEAGLRAAGLHPLAVKEVWNSYLAGKPGLRYTDIFCLVNLVYWARQHRLEVPNHPSGRHGACPTPV
jgi:asparagine synthase (glutamine-hydrolysing)